MGSTHSFPAPLHFTEVNTSKINSWTLRVLSLSSVTIQKICEQHSLHLCSGPFHEGEYVVNQFLGLTDFIITIIGNNIQDELVGV